MPPAAISILRISATLACLGALPSARAQSAALPAGPSPGVQGVTSAAKDEAVALSVFEVTADRDDSYEALSSTALTGTRKDLRRLPLSAEVQTRALIDDLAITDMRESLEFIAGAGNSLISGGTSDPMGDLAGDRVGGGAPRLRGLAVAVRRNGLLFGQNYVDNFSLERFEVIRGPQSLLYGSSQAAGVMLVNTKRARFGRNSGFANYRWDSEGSERAMAEVNATGALGGTKLAALISVVKDSARTYRTNIESETGGLYANLAFRPVSQITFRFEHEQTTRQTIEPMTARLAAPTTNATYGARATLPLRLLVAQGRAGDLLGGGLGWHNAESFGLDGNGQEWLARTTAGSLEIEVTRWLSAKLETGLGFSQRDNYNAGAFTGLTPPGLSSNPTGEWAVGYRPGIDPLTREDRGYRALFNATFATGRHLKHDLSFGAERTTFFTSQLAQGYYEIDANGAFITNATQLNNATSGRTVMPIVWWPLSQGFDGPAGLRRAQTRIITVDGRRYLRSPSRLTFPQFATADNPRGYSNGSTGVSLSDRTADGAFAALSSAWFDGRFDTMLGYRYDTIDLKSLASPADSREFKKGTYMAGVNWRAHRFFTLYAGYSTSFNPTGTLDIFSRPLPVAEGKGKELGIKFELLEDRLSGSLSAYAANSLNESANLPNEVRDVVDSPGLNGRNGGVGYSFDRITRGLDLSITARPLKGLRIQAGFAHIDAKDDGDVRLPIFYNDQFNTNAAGQVTLNSGTGSPLLVPVNPATAGFNPLNPGATSTQILTVAMLRNGDAAGNYRANLDPANGRILNAAALYLTTSGVGTGNSGLPITQHQLGFVPPGGGTTFLAKAGGDRTTGYPANAFNFAGAYRFSDGRLKGLTFGVNARVAFDQLAYYYTDRVTNPAAPERKLFTYPDRTLVGALLGYEWRPIRKVRWRTQLNVANVFDKVQIRLVPNVSTGVIDNARLDASPRTWTLTNTLSF